MKETTAQEEVARIINEERLDNKSRKRELVYRRNFLMWYLRQKTFMSQHDIALMFNRTHATVVHGVSCVNEALRTNDDYFFDMVSDIKNRLDSFNFNKPKFKKEKRSVVSVYMSNEEYEQILNAANDTGLTMHQFALDCIKGNRSLLNIEGNESMGRFS